MDIENLPQRGLVTTGQVPSDRQSKLVAGAEDQAVAFGQLETRKPATERVVDVRIGASLVQQDIAIGEASDLIGDASDELGGLILALLLLPCGVVRDPIGLQIAEDLRRAVAVVHVVIEDAHAADLVFRLQG